MEPPLARRRAVRAAAATASACPGSTCRAQPDGAQGLWRMAVPRTAVPGHRRCEGSASSEAGRCVAGAPVDIRGRGAMAARQHAQAMAASTPALLDAAAQMVWVWSRDGTTNRRCPRASGASCATARNCPPPDDGLRSPAERRPWPGACATSCSSTRPGAGAAGRRTGSIASAALNRLAALHARCG